MPENRHHEEPTTMSEYVRHHTLTRWVLADPQAITAGEVVLELFPAAA